MSVLVLAGGLSPERDVSLRSGRRVADSLRGKGFDVQERDVDSALLAALAEDRPDCVVPMMHGAAGEDGAVREVLDCLGLPYVGSTPDACRLAFDKPVAKTLVRRAGIATPDFIALPQSTFRELGAQAVIAAIVSGLGLPLVAKPTRGGSALGMSVVHSADELPAAMVGAFAYGDVVLVERLVTGVEVAVSVVEDDRGPRALPAVEIVPDGGLYDYNARYIAGQTEFFVPARLPEAALQAAAETALLAHRTLGLRDWSRSDLVVDADDTVWFLEVNAAPGMTETSLLPQSVSALGEDVGAVLGSLVERARARAAAAETPAP